MLGPVEEGGICRVVEGKCEVARKLPGSLDAARLPYLKDYKNGYELTE